MRARPRDSAPGNSRGYFASLDVHDNAPPHRQQGSMLSPRTPPLRLRHVPRVPNAIGLRNRPSTRVAKTLRSPSRQRSERCHAGATWQRVRLHTGLKFRLIAVRAVRVSCAMGSRRTARAHALVQFLHRKRPRPPSQACRVTAPARLCPALVGRRTGRYGNSAPSMART